MSRPGTAADSLWYFRPGGSHVAVTQNITRTYRPVVASIGKDATDDIVWYAPGTAADSTDAMAFAQRAGVKAMIERVALADAQAGLERMISGKARFRVVLDVAGERATG